LSRSPNTDTSPLPFCLPLRCVPFFFPPISHAVYGFFFLFLFLELSNHSSLSPLLPRSVRYHLQLHMLLFSHFFLDLQHIPSTPIVFAVLPPHTKTQPYSFLHPNLPPLFFFFPSLFHFLPLAPLFSEFFSVFLPSTQHFFPFLSQREIYTPPSNHPFHS